MRIDYLGLEAFVAIADKGSFSRAAAFLNLSQTALSHRLRKIEEDLGTPLFTRSSREVSLTASGQGLLPDARRLLHELQHVYDAVRDGARRIKRTLSFGCLPTLANAVMAPVLKDFADKHPDIALHIFDVPVAQIAEVVRTGRAEFGLTVMATDLSDLQMLPLVDEEYCLIVPEGHSFAERGSVTRDDLDGATMVRISTQSKNRQLVEIALAEHRERMIWQYEVQNAVSALQLVATGAALTILPASAISAAPVGLVPVPFTDVTLTRTLGVISRRGIPLPTRATDFLDLVEHRLKEVADHRGTITAGAAGSPRLIEDPPG